MQNLTKRQRETYDVIKDFIQRVGYPPTNEEIGERLNIHEATVREHMMHLEQKGWIERKKHKPRTIKLV